MGGLLLGKVGKVTPHQQTQVRMAIVPLWVWFLWLYSQPNIAVQPLITGSNPRLCDSIEKSYKSYFYEP